MAIMALLLLEEVDGCVTLAPLLTVSLSLCKYDPSKPPLTVFLDFLTEILAEPNFSEFQNSHVFTMAPSGNVTSDSS